MSKQKASLTPAVLAGGPPDEAPDIAFETVCLVPCAKKSQLPVETSQQNRRYGALNAPPAATVLTPANRD
jgi:hypothetical protein